jgi:hypothetical protein
MQEKAADNESKGWKEFLRKHRIVFALFVVAAVMIVLGAVYVFLWFVGDAQSIGMVPSVLGMWSMGHFVTFTLHLIFWEIVLVGIPLVLAGVAGWLWWRKLPSEEKMEHHFFGRRSRTTGGSGGVSLFFFIAFCIKIYLDGKWSTPIGTWTLNYVVYSMLSILAWVVVIFGIPAVIVGIWWLSRGMRKRTRSV